MSFKDLTMILAGLVIAISFNTNAGVIELSYSYDSVNYYTNGWPNNTDNINAIKPSSGSFNITIDDSAVPVLETIITDNDYMYREIISTSFYSSLLNISEMSFAKEYTDQTLLNGDIDKLNSMRLAGAYVLSDYTDPSTQDIILTSFGIGGYLRERKVEIFGDQNSGTFEAIITSTHMNRAVEFRAENSFYSPKPAHPTLDDIINIMKNNPVSFITGVYQTVEEISYSNYQVIEQTTSRSSAQLYGEANYTAVPEPSTLAIFALGIMGLASRRFKKQ